MNWSAIIAKLRRALAPRRLTRQQHRAWSINRATRRNMGLTPLED
jgi:hypothetical protein